jgi:predicted amidohydrolase
MVEQGHIIIPADFPFVRIKEWRKMLLARAMQMGCTVIGVNTPDGGNSMVVTPDGEIFSEIPEKQTALKIVDFDIYNSREEWVHDRDYKRHLCGK